MSEELKREYRSLKEKKGRIAATSYLEEMQRIADAYIRLLEDAGVMPQPLEAKPIA